MPRNYAKDDLQPSFFAFQIIFYMITLSLVTPLGVIIGMVITEYVDSQSAIQIFIIGILQGLAGGTLLYITFFEVLDRDKLSKLGLTSLYGCFSATHLPM